MNRIFYLFIFFCVAFLMVFWGQNAKKLFIERKSFLIHPVKTIVGANIKIKGADSGTITDLDGNFHFAGSQ